MSPALSIDRNVSLQPHNTFRLPARASHYVRVTNLAQLNALRADTALAQMQRFILGGGSNLLLTQDLDAVVLHMGIMGREVVGTEGEATLVRAGAGESWHGFVDYTLTQGLGGLENLSLIPGTVGASPIQNIGAYGVEVKDVFHSLTAYDFNSGDIRTMDSAACGFGYRDSIFKHPEGANLIVLDVTFALPNAWRPNLAYAELGKELASGSSSDLTPRRVSEAVIAIRQRKLPNPEDIGNAGSFFKNPIVSKTQLTTLLERFPQMAHHVQPDGSAKLAAGWLIDQCGWKGRSIGAAGVYPKQALVLVNNGGATGSEVLALARAIQHDVAARFGVTLEPEPVVV